MYGHKMTNNPPPPIKISEAILRMAEPLIRKYPKRERITAIIDLAIFSWNMSLSPEEIKEEMERDFINQISVRLGATDIAMLLEQADTLIEKKEKLYPDINYLIVGRNLTFEDNGKITFDVNTINLQK